MSANSDSSKKFKSVAKVLGLGTLEDCDDGIDRESLRKLYRHARNEDGQRCIFMGDSSFKKGWVNLEANVAKEILSAIIPLDDADDTKHAHKMAQANLEAQPWNDVLGIEHPAIQCRVKIHGKKWALRFQSATAVLRGSEIVNEQLPPIPDDTDETHCDGTANPFGD